MSRPLNFLQMCSCGHYGNVHHNEWPEGVAPGHGMCLVDGCKCEKFTWVCSLPTGSFPDGVGVSEPKSKPCMRCNDQDPDCYICGGKKQQ
jgi:hypothetical protein